MIGWSSSDAHLIASFVLAVILVDIVWRLVRNRIERKGYPLPPGPLPLPFLGSALSVNIKEPFKTYTEWRKTYGDIVYLRILDMDLVVLNSPSVAADLLEKRAQIYSNRPFIATLKPYGHETTFAFAQYDDHLKLCRKIFHQTFRADTIINFHPMQLCKSRDLILSMIEKPDNYTSHFVTFASSLAMYAIYGYEPKSQGDPIATAVIDFLYMSLPALLPEKAVFLKMFPFLLHAPDWFPGSWIKEEAKRSRELGAKTFEDLFKYTQRHMNYDRVSMVSNHIKFIESSEESYRSKYEKVLKDTAGTALIASVGTVMATLMAFTLAMVKHPHILKRAQKDIDAVVGTERLPNFSDRPHLPYVDAIMRECLRWSPPGPLGIPHAASTSDVYNGFYIPKGAIVIGNIWAMSRDEIRYSDPESFIPERFLNTEGKLTDDKVDHTFGFGRRVCPGKHNADTSMWIAMATMLATLNFGLAKNAYGREVDFEAEYMDGLAHHVLTFPCSITPRSHINRTSLES